LESNARLHAFADGILFLEDLWIDRATLKAMDVSSERMFNVCFFQKRLKTSVHLTPPKTQEKNRIPKPFLNLILSVHKTTVL